MSRQTVSTVKKEIYENEIKNDDFNYADTNQMIPSDQLNLMSEELKEEHTRLLKASNPNKPDNKIMYCHRDGRFNVVPIIDELTIHLDLHGNYIHFESDEAKVQFDKIKSSKIILSPFTGKLLRKSLTRKKKDPAVRERYIKMRTIKKAQSSVDEEDEEEGDGENKKKKVKKQSKQQQLATPNQKQYNQFDNNDRSVQTTDLGLKDAETLTELPPRNIFSDTATLDKIYDAYEEDFERIQRLNVDTKKSSKQKDKFKGVNGHGNNNTRIDLVQQMCNSAVILERMVNQNTHDDIIEDFKYWEDKADLFRESVGTLLPLWKFSYKEARALTVTGICWNPKYSDLFTVGFGSYDFTKKTKGYVISYSLKNPLHPYCVYEAESGCVSVDVHPELTHFIVAGFYNGSVAVYNMLDIDNKTYLCASNSDTCTHCEPVWQVRWEKNDIDNNLNFLSISSDGKMNKWAIRKKKLFTTEFLNLKNISHNLLNENNFKMSAKSIGCGTCFEINKQNERLFLIGTEQGLVYQCSKGYQNEIIKIYEAHTMSVYAIKWNPFYAKYFMTCSSDWIIRIWDYSLSDPLMHFDLSSPVNDIAWAPYSSTVFAAVTADSEIIIFDLNTNKYEPICRHKVTSSKLATRRAKLTHIAFSNVDPILLVGDDRGHIISFKLSPNLRKKTKDAIKKDFKAPEGEILKFDRIMNTFKDKESVRVELKALEIDDPPEIQAQQRLEMERKEMESKSKKKTVKISEKEDKNENNDEISQD